MAVAEHNSNNLDIAEEIYTKIITIQPNLRKTYQMMGFIYLKSK
jgi:hypothetical protein